MSIYVYEYLYVYRHIFVYHICTDTYTSFSGSVEKRIHFPFPPNTFRPILLLHLNSPELQPSPRCHVRYYWNLRANCLVYYCNTLQHTATQYNTLQYKVNCIHIPAMHCITLQHTATHYPTRRTLFYFTRLWQGGSYMICKRLCCNTPQLTATHRNLLQHTTPYDEMSTFHFTGLRQECSSMT